ncbi:MAG: hypothetical protein ACON4C_05905 [Henriciella sp.]|jgi:hypothetical protein
MADLISMAASAAGGGLFGLAGTVLGRVASYVEQRQAMAHEVARWAHELKRRDLEIKAEGARVAAEQALQETQGRWQGLAASMAAEGQIGPSYPWVDAVRGLTRPGLTLLLWLISGAIWMGADASGRAAIIETASFAATAATLWWFGDRGPRRPSV